MRRSGFLARALLSDCADIQRIILPIPHPRQSGDHSPNEALAGCPTGRRGLNRELIMIFDHWAHFLNHVASERLAAHVAAWRLVLALLAYGAVVVTAVAAALVAADLPVSCLLVSH